MGTEGVRTVRRRPSDGRQAITDQTAMAAGQRRLRRTAGERGGPAAATVRRPGVGRGVRLFHRVRAVHPVRLLSGHATGGHVPRWPLVQGVRVPGAGATETRRRRRAVRHGHRRVHRARSAARAQQHGLAVRQGQPERRVFLPKRFLDIHFI